MSAAAALLPVLLAVTPTAEAAADAPAEGRRVIVAGKMVAATARVADHGAVLFGPGVDVEVELWAHGLEVELAGALLLGDELTVAPVEVLLKYSWHVEAAADLFVAGGGVVDLVERAGQTLKVFPGGIVLAGAYLWHGEHIGLVLEMSYAAIAADMGLEHDLEGAVGVAYRF